VGKVPRAQGGSPQITVVWVGLEGDEIVIGHIPEHKKLRNIRRDPRVALSMQATTESSFGLIEYLVLYGRAQVVRGGSPELLQWLAHIYLGPDVKFPPMDHPPPGYVTRVEIERISGVGPWTGRAT